MNFRQALCFYLKGHGLTDEECAKVCEEQRVAFSLKLKDPGGMLDDLRSALCRIPASEGTQAARTALQDPGEKLLLMSFLSESINGADDPDLPSDGAPLTNPCNQFDVAASAYAPVAQPPKAAAVRDDKDLLLERIFTEMSLTRPEKNLLVRLFA